MQKDCRYYAKKYDVISSYSISSIKSSHKHLPVALLFYTISFGPGFVPYVFKMASSQQKWSIEEILNRRTSTEQRQVPGGISFHYFPTVITATENLLHLVAMGHHKFNCTGFKGKN